MGRNLCDQFHPELPHVRSPALCGVDYLVAHLRHAHCRNHLHDLVPGTCTEKAFSRSRAWRHVRNGHCGILAWNSLNSGILIVLLPPLLSRMLRSPCSAPKRNLVLPHRPAWGASPGPSLQQHRHARPPASSPPQCMICSWSRPYGL